MCYKPDKNTDFHWRTIEEEPDMDHIYLVSDGINIGLAGSTWDAETGDYLWYYVHGDNIPTTTYYACQEIGLYGKPLSKEKIEISDIKYWAPIPSPSLQKLER